MIKITKKKRYENPLMKKKHELNRLFGGFTKDEYNAILTFGT